MHPVSTNEEVPGVMSFTVKMYWGNIWLCFGWTMCQPADEFKPVLPVQLWQPPAHQLAVSVSWICVSLIAYLCVISQTVETKSTEKQPSDHSLFFRTLYWVLKWPGNNSRLKVVIMLKAFYAQNYLMWKIKLCEYFTYFWCKWHWGIDQGFCLVQL